MLTCRTIISCIVVAQSVDVVRRVVALAEDFEVRLPGFQRAAVHE